MSMKALAQFVLGGANLYDAGHGGNTCIQRDRERNGFLDFRGSGGLRIRNEYYQNVLECHGSSVVLFKCRDSNMLGEA